MVLWDHTLDWLSVPLDLSFGTGAHHFPICKICFMERDDFEMKPAPLFAFFVPEFTSRSGKEGPNFSHFGCNSSTLPSRSASIVPHSGKPRSWREKGIAKKDREGKKRMKLFSPEIVSKRANSLPVSMGEGEKVDSCLVEFGVSLRKMPIFRWI